MLISVIQSSLAVLVLIPIQEGGFFFLFLRYKQSNALTGIMVLDAHLIEEYCVGCLNGIQCTILDEGIKGLAVQYFRKKELASQYGKKKTRRREC